jgi:pyroglutamyl-peptidase
MATRILATGFSAFPRAPVNPTETLVAMLNAARPDLGPDVELMACVLPVEYARAPAMLAEIGRDFRPDIAVHFGLADSAKGFRLETTARNRSSVLAPDAAGMRPEAMRICPGPNTLRSGLPLEAIERALSDLDLPVQTSGNAGAYLCNHIFYLSRSGRVPDFEPAMSGFVHVPFLDEQLSAIESARAARLFSMTRDQLLAGAGAILQCCAEAHRSRFPVA